MPSYFNVRRLIRKAASKPLVAAQRCRSQMEKLEAGYHKGLHDVVAGAYAATWHFRKSPAEWQKFLKKPFWKKAKTPKGDKGVREELHRVMLYVCDAISDPAYDRAYKYARGLEPYLVKKIPPNKVRKLIEDDGGLEKLYDRAKKELPLRKGVVKSSARTRSETVSENDLDRDDDVGKDDRDEEVSSKEAESNGRVRKSRPCFEIEMSPERLERAFAMTKGQEGVVRFKAVGGQNGRQQFIAMKLKIPAKPGEFGGVERSERRRVKVSATKIGAQRLVTSGPPRASSIPGRRRNRL